MKDKWEPALMAMEKKLGTKGSSKNAIVPEQSAVCLVELFITVYNKCISCTSLPVQIQTTHFLFLLPNS